jgi:glutamate N-acetyltransferase/amino-acid N-acetyltransferase
MKEAKIESVIGGTVTSPKGFTAGAAFAGVKESSKRDFDIGILYSEIPCQVAATFTKNTIKSAPVLLDQQRLGKGTAQAVIANSGNANASTGEKGMVDAVEMTSLAAGTIGIDAEHVLVSSTGVIGKHLPMVKIRKAIGHIALSTEGGHDFARAIMTTDRVPKEVAVTVEYGETKFTIGGVAKGSGMIHPNMATMLCYLTTDAAVTPEFLNTTLRHVVDDTFNMISVDGDTSPSDTVILMANGQAKNKAITARSPLAAAFRKALEKVCRELARIIAQDGEGATKLIEVTVTGAWNHSDARKTARTVISSVLLKAAVHGADPNWGRVLAAVGRSGAKAIESKTDVTIGDIMVLRGGTPQDYAEPSVVEVFKRLEVPIGVNLNLGKASATAWGCDLSEEYVTINSEYMT